MVCKWWQRHKFSKWEYHKEIWSRQYTYRGVPYGDVYDVSRTYGERTCSRCGHKQRVRQEA